MYEMRHVEEFAAAYGSLEWANDDAGAVNHTVLLAADLGVLVNSATPASGEFPGNELTVAAIATGWIESEASGGTW